MGSLAVAAAAAAAAASAAAAAAAADPTHWKACRGQIIFLSVSLHVLLYGSYLRPSPALLLTSAKSVALSRSAFGHRYYAMNAPLLYH